MLKPHPEMQHTQAESSFNTGKESHEKRAKVKVLSVATMRH
jgi:hypothetical protein